MKSIKPVLTLLFTILFLTQIGAQDTKRDRIVLKDGSIIVGEILQYETGKDILFKLEMNGDTLTLKESKIYKIIFNGEPLKKKKVRTPFSFRNKKGFFEFSTYLMFGDLYNGRGFRGSYNYSFNPKVNLSLGINLDKYDQENNVTMITLNLGYRYYLNLKKVYPFAGVDLGYGIARNGNVRFQVLEKNGGLYYRPYLGLQLGLANKSAISISTGYRYQKAFYLLSDFYGDIISLDHKLKRFDLSFNFFSYF